MPFTPSHAVVALPFLRTPLIPAAIAIGAMTPDLPLFVRPLLSQYGRTHDLAWLPVTVLGALALLLVWRCVLRPAVRELSPDWLARRLPVDWDGGAGAAWRETFPPRIGAFLLLLASLAIGVLSHIVWDLFTHDGRAGVELFPALYDQWGPFFGYKWVQYASSAAGLVVIAIWALLSLRTRKAEASVHRILPRSVRWAWWASLPVLLLAAAALGIIAQGPLDADFTVAHLGYRVLLPATAVWGALTVALCIVVQIRRGGRDREGAPLATREP